MGARPMRVLKALFLALVMTAVAHARADDSAAIAAYRQGDLATARAEWIALLEDPVSAPQGPERGRILYDLGNCAFRAGKTLEAVGWYTAALRYRPRDADTWANLEEARSRARLEPADRGDLSGTLRRVVHAFTPAESRWLAALGLLVLAVGLTFEALRGGRLGRWMSLLAAAVALVLCAPAIDDGLRARGDLVLILEPDRAQVRSEPRDKAAVVAELTGGAQVERVDELPDWTKVRLEDGLAGWVKAGAVFGLRR